jgi:hypothetical protein
VNFVYVNVLENISRFFGLESWFYYIQELPVFITQVNQFFYLTLFGMALLIVYQAHGRLPGRARMSRFPFLVPFIALNLYVLMSVGHKE